MRFVRALTRAAHAKGNLFHLFNANARGDQHA